MFIQPSLASPNPTPATCHKQQFVLALSGGSGRGIAHIGVAQALFEHSLHPKILAGTSVGSLLAALLASGQSPWALEDLVRRTYWPALLVQQNLEKFCARFLPRTFEELSCPLVVVATDVKYKRPVAIQSGDLRSAVVASCALHYIGRRVVRDGLVLTDGGASCVLPSNVCRQLFNEATIIGSDVWYWGNIMRRWRRSFPRLASKIWPAEYLEAVAACDLIIQPSIPFSCILPSESAISKLIQSGKHAAEAVLNSSLILEYS